MNTLCLLAPILVLSAAAFLLFAVDAGTQVNTPKTRRISFWLAVLGVIISAFVIPVPPQGGIIFARNMLVWDGMAYFMTWISILSAFLIILLSENFSEFEGLRLSTYYGLLLFSAAGLIFLVSANDFLMVFLGLELFAVPSFILAGYLRHQERSTEAAMKLLLVGAFSSAMLIYGVALVYGVTGSTSLSNLHANAALLKTMAPLGAIGIFFILVSFALKIALVPFHLWLPDIFEGAPKPVTALISAAPKIAGAAIAFRVIDLVVLPSGIPFVWVFAILAALSMTVANLLGLRQTNVLRLLAYSSIAHMGNLLLGLVAGGEMGVTGLYLYGWVYLFMTLGVFAIVVSLSKSLGSDDITAYAGLSKRVPFLAALMAFFLISLMGVPPTAGFIAKFYVFQAAYQSGWLWLVLLAAINSVISAAYYFKIIHQMYFQEPGSDNPLTITTPVRLTLAATSVFTLALGLAPHCFVSAARIFAVLPKP